MQPVQVESTIAEFERKMALLCESDKMEVVQLQFDTTGVTAGPLLPVQLNYVGLQGGICLPGCCSWSGWMHLRQSWIRRAHRTVTGWGGSNGWVGLCLPPGCAGASTRAIAAGAQLQVQGLALSESQAVRVRAGLRTWLVCPGGFASRSRSDCNW